LCLVAPPLRSPSPFSVVVAFLRSSPPPPLFSFVRETHNNRQQKFCHTTIRCGRGPHPWSSPASTTLGENHICQDLDMALCCQAPPSPFSATAVPVTNVFLDNPLELCNTNP
jgi:hypothetical protein